MEKHIIFEQGVKTTNKEKSKKYFELLSWLNADNSRWICDFDLESDLYEVVNNIKENEDCTLKSMIEKNRPISKRKYMHITLLVSCSGLLDFIILCLDKEINVSILCGDVKLILNDNDGDIIIFDKKQHNTYAVKEKIKELFI